MFGISLTELFIVVIIAFMILGPDGLKKAAKKAGALYKELKAALDEIQKAVPDAKDLIEKTLNSDDKNNDNDIGSK